MRNKITLFQDSVVKVALTELHNKYIIVPVDKTSVVLIIRRFYAFTLTNKFG